MSDKLANINYIAAVEEVDYVRDVAQDIAAEVAHHIKIMYPDAVKACPSTFLLSVKGNVFNSIMGWLQTGGDGTAQRLAFNKAFRRHIETQYRNIRKEKP